MKDFKQWVMRPNVLKRTQSVLCGEPRRKHSEGILTDTQGGHCKSPGTVVMIGMEMELRNADLRSKIDRAWRQKTPRNFLSFFFFLA